MRSVHLPASAVAAACTPQPEAWYHNRARRVQFDAATMGMKVCLPDIFIVCVRGLGFVLKWGGNNSRFTCGCRQFTTDEVQHCLEAVPGRSYAVESIVSTTAKYGDKFKTLVRYWYATAATYIRWEKGNNV